MGYGIACNVCHVLISEGIGGLLATPRPYGQSSGPQYPKVLRNERLGDPEAIDQLVYAE